MNILLQGTVQLMYRGTTRKRLINSGFFFGEEVGYLTMLTFFHLLRGCLPPPTRASCFHAKKTHVRLRARFS